MVFDFCDHESSEDLHCGETCHEFLGHSYLCLEKDKLFPYFLKAKFIFFMSTTQYLELSASVSSAAIHLPEQSTRPYKDAGEDAN